MNFFQWMFHYNEICNVHTEIKKITIDRLDNIESSIQAFYLLVDFDKGQKLIEQLDSVRRKRYGLEESVPSGENKNNATSDDLLSDEEKALWDFMEEQPKTIKETREMRNVGRQVLPTINKKELIERESKAKIVEKLDKAPKLGF